MTEMETLSTGSMDVSAMDEARCGFFGILCESKDDERIDSGRWRS